MEGDDVRYKEKQVVQHVRLLTRLHFVDGGGRSGAEGWCQGLREGSDGGVEERGGGKVGGVSRFGNSVFHDFSLLSAAGSSQ